MAWTENKTIRGCKECRDTLMPGDRVWHEPRRVGLLSIVTRQRGVVEQSSFFCEECGQILEYEAK